MSRARARPARSPAPQRGLRAPEEGPNHTHPVPRAVTKPTSSGAQYASYSGYAHLAAGLCCGLSGLAAGMAIGVVGDAGVRAVGQQERLFVGVILILIFAEALGLYGLIVALILSQSTADSSVCT